MSEPEVGDSPNEKNFATNHERGFFPTPLFQVRSVIILVTKKSYPCLLHQPFS